MDAEERKAERMAQNRNGMLFRMDWEARIIGNKIVDGKRVTGIGEKIRSGSWDEWPQFFNVLIGQMSLAGTDRPRWTSGRSTSIITGAPVHKAGPDRHMAGERAKQITDFEEVVQPDTEYINHWSIALTFGFC